MRDGLRAIEGDAAFVLLTTELAGELVFDAFTAVDPVVVTIDGR